MEYRKLGMIDRDVSVIGLGCGYFDGAPYETAKQTIDAAIDHGVNIID